MTSTLMNLDTIRSVDEIKDTPKIAEVKDTYSKLAEAGLYENVLLYGESGSGKSELCSWIVEKINAKSRMFQCSRWNTKMAEEINAFCEGPLQDLGFFEGTTFKKHAVILDEVDQVGVQGMEQLRGIINLFPDVVFLASTNFIERMPKGFINRFMAKDLWDGVDYREVHRAIKLNSIKAA